MATNRKYEKIERIENTTCRNGAYVKRTKGIIKKAIELSILCDQQVFMYIYDHQKQRVIHYSSNPGFDILDVFNQENDREFLTNKDYSWVGGKLKTKLEKGHIVTE